MADVILTTPLHELVRQMRLLPRKEQRTARLNELIGHKSSDAEVLHRRALLITELHKGNVWPQGGGW